MLVYSIYLGRHNKRKLVASEMKTIEKNYEYFSKKRGFKHKVHCGKSDIGYAWGNNTGELLILREGDAARIPELEI